MSWFGVTAEVVAPDADSLARLVDAVPGAIDSVGEPHLHVRLEQQDGARRHLYSLQVDDLEPIELIEGVDMAIAIARDLLEHRVAESATEHVFLHAGVVGMQGRAILLPGSSGAGKTSLTTALVRAGLSYLSDEFAVLDDRGLVVPFPRPPAFVTSPGSAKERRPIATQQICTEALPIGIVALLEYDAAAIGLHVEAISGAEAVFSLLSHALPIRDRPGPVVDRLTAALEGSRALKGIRGPSESAVPALLRLLGQLD